MKNPKMIYELRLMIHRLVNMIQYGPCLSDKEYNEQQAIIKEANELLQNTESR